MDLLDRRLGIGSQHQAAVHTGLLDDVVASDIADESHMRRRLSHVCHTSMIADRQADRAATRAGANSAAQASTFSRMVTTVLRLSEAWRHPRASTDPAE
jgi:hypothetical protein